MGARSRRRPCRRPGKLEPGAQRTGIFSQRTAGQLFRHWISRAYQYGLGRQSRRVGSVGTGHDRAADRKRRGDWSHSDRDPGPGGGADGRARPRHRRFTETTLGTVRWRFPCGPAHSRAAPARSDVRSAPERSAFSETLRGEEAVNPRNFFAELKRSNIYKVAIGEM